MPWVKVESAAYWALFVAAFLSAAVWESLHPFRPLAHTAERRWGRHSILFVICTVMVAVVVRITPVSAAAAFAHQPYGLLNRPWMPFAVQCVLGILAVDFIKYAGHWFFHSVALLWRFHHVHHSDPDYDVSTGVRVHPIELVLMQAAYVTGIVVLAPPAIAVLVAELATTVLSFLNHANATLPSWLEKSLRLVIITPGIHRIHHSEEMAEQNRNLGEIFSWWDRIFGTYQETPAAGAGIVTGVKGYRDAASLGILFMLLHPFRMPREELMAPETKSGGAAAA